MLGGLIKELREEKKLTQSDFAKDIGISRTYVSEIENGRKIPSKEVLSKIRKRFRLPDDYFEVEEKERKKMLQIKITKVNLYKKRIISDMTTLDVYREEFGAIVDVFADLLYQYHLLNKEYEELGYPTKDELGKKPPIVAQLEVLRKDIGTYSDKLMLNPKSYQAMQQETTKPQSKLAEALMSIG